MPLLDKRRLVGLRHMSIRIPPIYNGLVKGKFVRLIYYLELFIFSPSF